MIERIFIYHRDRVKLTDWIKGRGDICEADVIELLIDRYLGEMESEFPKVAEDPDEDLNNKMDLRYERKQDERMGI